MQTLTKKQIKFLNRYTEGSWSYDPQTGLVDVVGTFKCSNEGLDNFKGVKFGKVSGDFDCSGNQLTSLEGAPQEVRVDFNCYDNKLTSLEGAPQKVGGHFVCDYNQLTSLEGAPQQIRWSFSCEENQLTSLEGAPQTV